MKASKYSKIEETELAGIIIDIGVPMSWNQ